MNNTYKLYSSLPDCLSHKVWAEIDLSALALNYRALADAVHRTTPGCRAAAVIKADAYGHCADACAVTLIAEGCRAFAVSSIEEALAVRCVCRDAGVTDAAVLILGHTPPDGVPELIRSDIIQACYSPEYAAALSASASAADGHGMLRVHMKIDTGMNRIGFAAHTADEISAAADAIVAASHLPGLSVCGAFSHFARADEELTPEGNDGDIRTREQARRFLSLTDEVMRRGVALPVRHICNSAASLRYPEYHLDACRLGIMLYGAEPSSAFDFPLRPVMKLKTVISQTHTLLAGEEAGYGGTYVGTHDTRLATIPVGYADGFIRAYTGARALIHSPSGEYRGEAHVVGRICMDQCMLDIDGIPAHEGDVVTLIGEDGQLDDLATRAASINYECLCLISARVPRVVIPAHHAAEA